MNLPEAGRKRRWRRWSLAGLMLAIALFALPLAGLRWWLDLPPCVPHAEGPAAWLSWARAECTDCHASPIAPPPLVAAGPGAVLPGDLAAHERRLDPATCVRCHAAPAP